MTMTLYTTNAQLYDAAFSWDVTDEVDWLLERLGPDCDPVLEPACGSSRMLEAFALRGIEAVGIDQSPEMIDIAQARLRELPNAHAASFACT
jgi:SAM-dependent methyltransferase